MIDLYAEQSDHFIGTTAAIISAIGMGASAGASIYGAHKQADAASEAAKLSTDAANHAADVQDAANKRAEAFARAQAENTWQNAEGDRRANYDLALAHHAKVGSIGTMLGLGNGGAMPAYVPSVDPRYTEGASPLPGAPVPVGSGQTPAAAAAPRVLARASVPSIGGMLQPGAPPIDPAQLAALRARMGGNTGPFDPRRLPSIGGYLGA